MEGADVIHAADRAGVNQLPGKPGGWRVSQHEPGRKTSPCRVSGIDQPLALRNVVCQRRPAKHVLPCVEARESEGLVSHGIRSDDNSIDGVVLGQALAIRQDAHVWMLTANRLDLVPIGRSHSDKSCMCDAPHGSRTQLSDDVGADQSNAERLGHKRQRQPPPSSKGEDFC